MLLIAKIMKPESIPAVTHVDGTGRVQTVTERGNRRYYDLIHTFGEMTGVPVLLNTSFNDNEEPIVETPDDALRCFLKTNIDYLVIGNRLVQKRLWKCKIFLIWPAALKRYLLMRIKKICAASPLMWKMAVTLKRAIFPPRDPQVRVPG